ncbi:Aim37p [Maudiozyma exigua]|uniref:Aim37p n=1 Tax=Maudiozyma exigua TaxID=34358 RepID=A0A9P7BB48_MAUEX|nr:Aim37p [Kazachstania exigua]
MSKYYSFEETVNHQISNDELPLVFGPLNDLESMQTSILPTGNLIMQIVPVTKWINEQRLTIITKYNEFKAKKDKFSAERRAEYNNIKDYLGSNIFNNEVENQNRLVPTSITAFAAFFTGRIMSHKSVGLAATTIAPRSIYTQVLKSLPSRIVTPWILMGSTFAIGTPHTWSNFTTILYNRYIPINTAENITKTWNNIRESIIEEPKRNIDIFTNETLPKSIKSIREQCVDIIQDKLENTKI